MKLYVTYDRGYQRMASKKKNMKLKGRLKSYTQTSLYLGFLLVAVNAKFIHSNPAIYSLRACAGEELCRFVELAEYTIKDRKSVV